MKVAESILDTIGNTPLMKLRRIPESEGIGAEILVKLEFFNPTGSLKDRIYREMITRAIERGDLEPGMEILEASTGNAGIACSFVGRVLGYRVTVVMPEGMSEERKQLIRAFGGELMLTPGGESDVDLCLKKIESLINEHPRRYWFPNQFSNPDNPAAHYKTTGPEIWEQTGGDVDCFLASQGTGGTLTGVGKFLREKRSGVRLYAVEPSEAPIIAHGRWGSHKIEGIGDGFIPRNLDLSILDGVITVSSEEAIRMTRRLIMEEGIFCGISSGCNVVAAIKLAKRHPELRRIVTMVNDSGNRYFSTEVFGVKKELVVPEREHPLDEYSLSQLQRYQNRLEVIE
ncbi:MAG: cysteine synthase A [Aigarchaeota archaeon]|nr:cysteine synthase A [Candidatus Pelearchaeum maunauluense]